MPEHAPDAAAPRRARDLLTRDLATLSDTATLQEAGSLMRHLGVRHLPVFGETGLLGLVHLDDVTAAAFDASGPDLRGLAEAVPAVRLDDGEQQVLDALSGSRSGAVVVLDREDRLLGVITDADLVVRLPGSLSADAPLTRAGTTALG